MNLMTYLRKIVSKLTLLDQVDKDISRRLEIQSKNFEALLRQQNALGEQVSGLYNDLVKKGVIDCPHSVRPPGPKDQAH